MSKSLKIVLTVLFVLSTLGITTGILFRRGNISITSYGGFPTISFDFSIGNELDDEDIEFTCEDQVTIDLYGTIDIDVFDEESICHFDRNAEIISHKDDIIVVMEPALDNATIGNQYIYVSVDIDGVTYEQGVRFTVVDRVPPTLDVIASFQYDGVRAINYDDFVTSVSDNMTDEVDISFDDSQIDVMRVGTYQLVVIATDGSGNETRKNVAFNVVRPFVAGFEISERDFYPGGVDFELDLPNMVSNITYSIGYTNPRQGIWEVSYPEQYQRLFYDNSTISVTGFEEDDNLFILISYTCDLDSEQRLSSIELPIGTLYETLEVYDITAYTTEALISWGLNWEYQDNVTQMSLVDITSDEVIQTWDGTEYESEFFIDELEPNTEYEIQLHMDRGVIEPVAFQTNSQVEGDTVTLRIHYYDTDGDYTGSGVLIREDFNDYVTYELDGIDDFGGYVDVALPHDNPYVQYGQLQLVFMNNTITQESYDTGHQVIDIKPIEQRVYLEADIYFYDGHTKTYLKGDSERIVFAHIVMPQQFQTDEYQSYDQYLTFNDLPEDMLFPLNHLANEFVDIEYLVNDVVIPYRIAPIILDMDETDQFLRVDRRGLPFDIYFDEWDMETDSDNVYFIFEPVVNNRTEEEFFMYLEEEAPFYAVTGIWEIVYGHHNLVIYFQDLIAINDIMTMDISIVDEFGELYPLQNSSISEDTYLVMSNRIFEDIYVVGDFNNYNIEEAILLNGYDHQLVFAGPQNGSLQLLQDLDGDGLDLDDTLLDTPFEYSLEQGDKLFYMIESDGVTILIEPSRTDIMYYTHELAINEYQLRLVYYVGEEERIFE